MLPSPSTDEHTARRRRGWWRRGARSRDRGRCRRCRDCEHGRRGRSARRCDRDPGRDADAVVAHRACSTCRRPTTALTTNDLTTGLAVLHGVVDRGCSPPRRAGGDRRAPSTPGRGSSTSSRMLRCSAAASDSDDGAPDARRATRHRLADRRGHRARCVTARAGRRSTPAARWASSTILSARRRIDLGVVLVDERLGEHGQRTDRRLQLVADVGDEVGAHGVEAGALADVVDDRPARRRRARGMASHRKHPRRRTEQARSPLDDSRRRAPASSRRSIASSTRTSPWPGRRRGRAVPAQHARPAASTSTMPTGRASRADCEPLSVDRRGDLARAASSSRASGRRAVPDGDGAVPGRRRRSAAARRRRVRGVQAPGRRDPRDLAGRASTSVRNRPAPLCSGSQPVTTKRTRSPMFTAWSPMRS